MLNVFLDPFAAITAAHRTVIDNAGQLTGQVGLHLFVLLLCLIRNALVTAIVPQVLAQLFQDGVELLVTLALNTGQLGNLETTMETFIPRLRSSTGWEIYSL